MNKINFLTKNNFPLSSDTLEMMQRTDFMIAGVAALGGDNYILSGCVDDGAGNVSDGVVVIGGELTPFAGGAKKAKVTVVETNETLTALGEDYPEAYVYRVAQFADAGGYAWADFARFVSNRELDASREEVGFIKMWSGAIERLNTNKYVLCDGRTLTTADYPELAYAMGKETETTFNVPDLRGSFVAGYEPQTQYGVVGNKGGANVRFLTNAQLPTHRHIFTGAPHLLHAFGGFSTGLGQKAINTSTVYPAPDDSDESGHAEAFFTSYAQDADGNTNLNFATGQQSLDMRPPYYVVAFVMRIKN
jgi:microcystin-dependent protein